MKKRNIKEAFSSRSFKLGGFQTLVMVIVIALVVVLNLIVGKLNFSVDLSSDKIYTLTEETKELINVLSDDITLYYMCQSGNEVEQIEKVLNEYDRLKHITVEKKDPVVYPNFAKNYTDEELTGNDVIVVNNKTEASRFVTQSDMITQGYNSSYTATSTTLDAEGQITAAIWGVTTTDSKKIYVTSGHGEVDFDSEFTDILGKSNISTETLETKTTTEIPEDCDTLLIYGPVYDLTEEEYTLVSSYMKNGGRVLVFLNAEAEEQKNLDKLLSEYGIRRVKGYVVDTAQCYSPSYPTILQP
ncbi:MAG: GldG family protein, partial [Eubacterium sp.]|nr:GldG family protein [Eubacterium sp.]